MGSEVHENKVKYPLSHNWKLEDPSFESWSAKIYFSFTLSCFLSAWVSQKLLYMNLIMVGSVKTCQTHCIMHCISLLGLLYQNTTNRVASTTKFDFLTVLGTGSTKSRYQWVWFLLRPLTLACIWLSPCCVLAQPFLWACTTLMCLCVFKFCLFLRTPVRLDESLLQWPHFNLVIFL